MSRRQGSRKAKAEVLNLLEAGICLLTWQHSLSMAKMSETAHVVSKNISHRK